MVKRGKLGKEVGIKGKTLKGSMSKGFNKVIKCGKRKKIITGAIFISVLSLSCVGYFQSKSALASNAGDYKMLKISEKAENINSITAYDKIKKEDEINVLLLGNEKYIGNILKEDLVCCVESGYNSKVNLTDLSIDNASIYDQLNRYIDIDHREFDLVFLCFDNENEEEVSETNFGGIYEGIIRDLKYNNASVDIIPIIKHKTLVNDNYYQIINVLSKYYELEIAKVNEDVISKGVEGESIEDFRESYSNVLTDIIKNNIDNSKVINTEYKEMYYGVTTLLEPYKISVKGDKKKGFSVSEHEAKSNDKNDYIKYKIEGNIIGLSYETKKDGGIIEVYVNRVLYKRIDTNSENEEVKYILISSNLTGLNEVKIINGNGGEIKVLGVIASGDNTNPKEVENFNNILARNTGNYSSKSKNDSLYEGAKVESSDVKKSENNKEETTTKKPENTGGNTQSKPSTTVSKSNNNVSSNNSNEIKDKNEIKKDEGSSGGTSSKPNSSIENSNGVSNSETNNNGTNSWGGNNTLNSGNGGNNNSNNTGSAGNDSGSVNNSGNNGGDSENNINNSTNNGGGSGNNTNNSTNSGGNSGNNLNNSTNNGGGSGNNINNSTNSGANSGSNINNGTSTGGNTNNNINNGGGDSGNNSTNNTPSNGGSSTNNGGNNVSNGNTGGGSNNANNSVKPIEPAPPVENVTPPQIETPAE